MLTYRNRPESFEVFDSLLLDYFFLYLEKHKYLNFCRLGEILIESWSIMFLKEVEYFHIFKCNKYQKYTFTCWANHASTFKHECYDSTDSMAWQELHQLDSPHGQWLVWLGNYKTSCCQRFSVTCPWLTWHSVWTCFQFIDGFSWVHQCDLSPYLNLFKASFLVLTFLR